MCALSGGRNDGRGRERGPRAVHRRPGAHRPARRPLHPLPYRLLRRCVLLAPRLPPLLSPLLPSPLVASLRSPRFRISTLLPSPLLPPKHAVHEHSTVCRCSGRGLLGAVPVRRRFLAAGWPCSACIPLSLSFSQRPCAPATARQPLRAPVRCSRWEARSTPCPELGQTERSLPGVRLWRKLSKALSVLGIGTWRRLSAACLLWAE